MTRVLSEARFLVNGTLLVVALPAGSKVVCVQIPPRALIGSSISPSQMLLCDRPVAIAPPTRTLMLAIR
jgi:hypothetical protein